MQALQYYKRGIAIAVTVGDEAILANLLQNTAGIYHKQQNYQLAINTYHKSLAIAERLEQKTLIKDNHLGLANAYEQSKELYKSLNHRKHYEKWNDSILNETHLKDISELSIKYETEKKEKEILELSQQSVANEAALSRQGNKIKLLWMLLFVVIITFALSFYNFQTEHQQ